MKHEIGNSTVGTVMEFTKAPGSFKGYPLSMSLQKLGFCIVIGEPAGSVGDIDYPYEWTTLIWPTTGPFRKNL